MAKRKLPSGIFRPIKRGWEAKVYHFRLSIHGRRQSFQGYSEIELTLRLRTELVRAIERRQAGEAVPPSSNKLLQRHLERLKIVEPQKGKSLEEWITEYAHALRVAEDGEEHVNRSEKRLRKIIAGCGFKALEDIVADKIANWLYDQRQAGKLGKTTSNHYAKIVKAFCRFVGRSRDGRKISLDSLQLLKCDDDIRVRRRPLTASELDLLLAATAKNRNKRQVQPADRVMVYLLGFTSGLRACELASLTPASFRLAGTPPTVTVRATISKRRKEDVLPLGADVAAKFRRYLTGKPIAERLWPGRWFRRAAEMLRSDLRAAGIEPIDEHGHVLDFHAIRHGFVTQLALSGVQPKMAQALARHSTINLTMNTYSHVGQQVLADALNQAFVSSVRPPVRRAGRTRRRQATRGNELGNGAATGE